MGYSWLGGSGFGENDTPELERRDFSRMMGLGKCLSGFDYGVILGYLVSNKKPIGLSQPVATN